MFPAPRITTVFASRWKALGWSASVLTTAYCSIPAPGQEDVAGVTADPAPAVVAAINDPAPALPMGGHASPWAITRPGK